MNEVTEKLLVQGGEAIAKVMEYVESTESFVVEQAPLLVQEILTYSLFYNGVWSVFWGLAFGGVMYATVKLWRILDTSKNGEDPCFAFMLGLFGGGATLAGFLVCLFTVAKIILAPRLFLMEQLKGLL
ncbi:hypothetical protein LCGC14_0209650 [marine sediment metagenome]|uniref:Uncharacterized protein n=1 Tax=marine sediment metagenome TaxID=412755 RepID=A0A0F9ULI6_9ZZZZ